MHLSLWYRKATEMAATPVVLSPLGVATVPSSVPAFLHLVELANQAVILLMRHLHEEILPIISAYVNEYTQCSEMMDQFLATFESNITSGLESSLDRARAPSLF
eukprot:TRINITY_DN1842_c0_g1_i6.p2 TRINITY_DN1842_c0_g1~~TRINITY_DN1842_c0_g1_i6.p2  ORF type:complete len:104 (+),score=16.29 TRINITY_DN1842_c0_g1_i6:228-539(+)